MTTGALPPGLILDPSTGVITGTPATPGSYSFTITASSTVSGIPSTTARSYTVSIAAAAAVPAIPTGTGTAAALAPTGFDPSAWIATAAALLVVGAGLSLRDVAIGRRRRATRPVWQYPVTLPERPPARASEPAVLLVHGSGFSPGPPLRPTTPQESPTWGPPCARTDGIPNQEPRKHPRNGGLID